MRLKADELLGLFYRGYCLEKHDATGNKPALTLFVFYVGNGTVFHSDKVL